MLSAVPRAARARRADWSRLGRQLTGEPFALLLVVAAALQLGLATSGRMQRPGWGIAGAALFAVVCVLGLAVRRLVAAQAVAAYLLLAVAGCWRAADRAAVNSYGAIALCGVVWLGFYGSRRQVLLAVPGVAAAMLAPELVIRGRLSGLDWQQAAAASAVSALVGLGLHALVSRGAEAARRADELEPMGTRLAAVLRGSVSNIIIVCDPAGTIVEFNIGAERALGYRAEEVVGKRTPVLFHDPADLAVLAARLGTTAPLDTLREAARRHDLEARDMVYLTKDGRRLTVSASISEIRDASGRLTGYVGLGSDVTRSRQMLDTVKTQQTIYDTLVDRLPSTTVALLDEQLRVVTIGGHWLAKAGLSAPDVRGIRILDVFHEQDRARGRELYERARTEPVEERLDLVDGTSYEFVLLPVAGPMGQRLVMSVAREITDRRQMERERQDVLLALAVSEATFREAFEDAPIGMALTSIGSGDERFLRVNPAFAAILGRRPDELTGVPVAEVTHPEDAHLLPDPAARAARATLRKRFVRPSGRPVWVEISYTVARDAEGRPTHVIEQVRDIHAIKESERALLDALEQQRAATARLRELDRIRTDLVGTISHELRTPLTSIHGYLELLGEEELEESQRTMIDVAARNAERLGNLVDNLLVLVRLDAVDVPGSDRDTDVPINEVVAAAADMIRPEVRERRQSLSVSLADGEPSVHGDADQLDRVLTNLLSNAVKYTPAGGRIDIEAAVSDGAVSVRIRDTGIGIPPDEQAHLFTRFFRASTARATSISGNGLGLAIVKSIVERHSGAIAVSSVPGRGSAFTVTLPLSRRPAVAARR